MPGDAFSLPVESVLRHARSVDDLADDVRQARSAAGEASMDSAAYGQLCQFLPALLNPLFSLAAGGLYDAEDALRETSRNLRAVAHETAATDNAVAGTIASAYFP